MKEFKWVWGLMRKYRAIFFTALGLVFVVNLLNLINPIVQGKIVDEVIEGGMLEKLLPFVLLMIGNTVVRAALRYTYLYMFENVSQNVVYNARRDVFRKVQELDFDFFDRTRTGDIMARITGDLDAVRHFTAYVLYSIFMHTVTLILALTVMFIKSATFTLVLLAITPITGILAVRLSGTVRPAFSAIREQFARLNSVVQENISGNRVVKAFAQEEYEIYKFSRENSGFRDSNIRASRIWEKYLPVMDAMAGLLSVQIILVGGIMVINRNITLGDLVTFNSFLWALNNPMRMIGWLINDTQRFATSAEKVMMLLNREPRIKSREGAIVKKPEGRVEFRNVSFKYGKEPVLEDISFSANPGQTVAIVGPTGSGKSTLVSLISRFYDCTGGSVLVDGIDVRDYDVRTLRDNIAVAMQDVFLFSETIEGNIAYGAPDVSVEKVKWAAQLACAHDFIMEFPEGFDTIIGERGVGLSGGQKQRIALARAIVKEAPIVILDDTTSSVDIETEHQIQQNLRDYCKNRTTFIIAHRISSVKHADLILVLEGGRIVERGTHDELLAMKGRYYDIFVNQYGDFDKVVNE
ncbi:MAG: ABC transporter ATP-binding protein [Clostridiaceae bacterium]|jgi:ATP-binding cassette subfamily B protein|nr:ABC transporter ATP-binding protein [Clostridiaceae bacterium]